MTGEAVAAAATAIAAYGLPGTALDLPERPLSPRDWAVLLNRVVHERLTGLAAAAVDSGALPVTEQQRQQIDDSHVTAMVQALLLERTAIDVVSTLNDAGIPTRLLKGTAVAHLDYPDPSLRPFGDVDILVRGAMLQQAVAALEAVGIRRRFVEPRAGFAARFGKGLTLATGDDIEIDLHRTLAHGSYGFTVPLSKLWEQRSTFRLAGARLAALGPEDRLLHAAYHAVLGTRPVRLLCLRDVAEMALFGLHEDQAVIERAAEWRAQAVLARAITQTWQELAIADVTRLSRWAERYQPSETERRRLAAYDRPGNPYSASALSALPYVPGVRGKVAYARSLTLPDRDFLAERGQSRRTWVLRGVRGATHRR